MIAVPTAYQGILFRSKLEADWACYFDFYELPWSYETEHYKLCNGAEYLPDFHLPTLDIFVECRGNLKRSLAKPALFLKELSKPLLIALPEGRFFLASLIDEETGRPYYGFLEAMFAGDETWFTHFQKEFSCFVVLEHDAEGDQRCYFANMGFSSPDYCGYSPDWMTCISDRNRKGCPNADARAYYYGGYSTWEQRGFRRPRWYPGPQRNALAVLSR